MHRADLRQDVLLRAHAARGGRDRAYERIRPERTAHLIIDMQNGFIEPGAPLEVPMTRQIVGNINRISDTVRAVGALNVFFRFTVDPDDPWDAYLDAFGGSRFVDESGDHCFVAGKHDHRLYPAIDVEAADLTIDKFRFSAFVPGSSSALELLRSRGIDTVVITGTLSNCCCEATARDAHQLGLRVLFVDDANAALSDDDHSATINSLAPLYADIVTTDDVCRLLHTTTEKRKVAS